MSNEKILGQLVSSEKIFNITPKSTYAWEGEISILKNSLSDLSGFIHFEFMIPRVGKRVDVLIIIKNIIFIIEFKVGSESYDGTAITQVYDYALDLKNFHEGSHDKIILPILISTKAEDRKNHLVKSKDNIYDIIFSNGENINKIINQILDIYNTSKDIDHNLWLNSSYKPTPNIIEAAQALYEGHSVEEISRSDAGATNLSVTSNKLSKIILYSKKNKKKTICFVTGVPGAGKTLVGLNVATDQSESIGLGKETVFLSDRSDVRSSYYLEDVATEYHIQGLELDWVCLCWDAGLRRNSDKWEFYRFLGNSYKKRNKEEEKKYLINAYRVLLTRARQGIVVFMPKGDISDPTRAPSYYNETYDYLLNCGFEEID